MPKQTFKETTTVAGRVFFEGDAEISDADAKTLKEEITNENEANGQKTDQKETQKEVKGK